MLDISANGRHNSLHDLEFAISFSQVVTSHDNDPDYVIPGLFAAGEAGCASAHGANRLGANSLLDIVVFGRACANRIAEISYPGEAQKELSSSAGDQTIARLDEVR